MIEPKSLADQRWAAARITNGVSNDSILRAVLALLDGGGLQGRVLDFGAGSGELIRHLLQRPRFKEIVGVDLFDRPADLPGAVTWHKRDLNDGYESPEPFDVVVSTEVIEHLENPRQMMRTLARLIRPGGTVIITTPNQESIRSYCALIVGGHFAGFLGASYPAHITALLRMDLHRIAIECGFQAPHFTYTGKGGLPKAPGVTWQEISFNGLRGRLFSDNLVMHVRKEK